MFDVGDLVVCVDARSAPKSVVPGYETIAQAALRWLQQGQHYRIASFAFDEVRLVGDPLPTLFAGGFNPARFRKIDAPDTEVSRMIRACKPVREGQPA